MLLCGCCFFGQPCHPLLPLPLYFRPPGPKAAEPGYASVCEAFGGFRHLNGYSDRPPVRPNISLGDTLAGLHAAFGAVMALLHRQRAGQGGSGGGSGFDSSGGGGGGIGGGGGGGGQVVDAAISESVFNMLESCVAEAAMAGLDRAPSGSTISGVVPSGTFRTQDGRYAVIGGNGDSVYDRLMGAIGRPDMGISNPKYATNPARVEAEAEIMGAIAAWCAARPLGGVLEAMRAARVPAGPILSTADILREPQYAARGMFERARPPATAAAKAAATAAAPRREEVTMPAILPKMGTPGRTRWAGAGIGHHTDEVLRGELGCDAAELARLRALGAIA